MKKSKLDILIDTCGARREELERLKDKATQMANEIKEMLGDTKSYETKLFKATVSQSERISYDDAALLDVIKESPLAERLVKIKEYVDIDELENLIYQGAIDKSLAIKIKSCITSKKTTALRLTRKKGG